MKTLLEINNLIGDQLSLCSDLKAAKERDRKLNSKFKAAKTRLEFLYAAKRYIETEPIPDLITLTISNTEEKLRVIANRFDQTAAIDKLYGEFLNRALAEHNRKYGVKKMKEQVKFLKFIIK